MALKAEIVDDWTDYDAVVDSLRKHELRNALKNEARMRFYYQEKYRKLVEESREGESS